MDKGAHFHKCDFQVHTPRDLNWHGRRPKSKAERREFASNLVEACRQKGLGAVAITDHHDMALVQVIRKAADVERDLEGNLYPIEERLVVFPGMELTLGVPCQALLVFDADLPEDLFELVLTALAIDAASPDEKTTAQLVRLDHIQNFETLKKELDKYAYLKSRYTVLPNVNDGGEHTLLRKGHARNYKEMFCVGGYVDGSVEDLGKGNRSILAGRASQWGSKKVAVFQTSDNRSVKFDRLGRHATWVKWATPKAEAIRQACLASESRISQVDPSVPSTAIVGIRVSNSTFLGRLNLYLNRQYNAIIGGRGTGKSTILEYARWALCDQPPTPLEDEGIPNYQARRKKLIEGTLGPVGGTVEVRFLLNDIPHVVRRSTEASGIQLKIADGEFETHSEREVRQLLPVQAYSQKQLSHVGIRLDELKRFITSPIQAHLAAVEQTFSDLANTTQGMYRQIQRKRALETSIATEKLGVNSLRRQAEKIRKGMKGLTTRERAILAQKTDYDEAEHLVSEWREDLQRARDAISSLKADLAGLPTDPHFDLDDFAKGELLDEMHSEAVLLFHEIDEQVSEIEKRLSAFEGTGSDFSKLRKKWASAKRTYEKSYKAAMERSKVQEERLEALSEIEDRLADARKALASRQSQLTRAGNPEAKYGSLREDWRNAYTERSDLLEEQCTTLTEFSGGELRAQLQKGAGFDSLEEKLRSAVARSGLRKTKVDAIRSRVIEADDPVVAWEMILEELEALASVPPDDDGELERIKASNYPHLSDCSFGVPDLRKVASRLTPEAWVELALTQIEDEPEFSYRIREGEYIAFEDASAGQQATVLLRTLLNQGGPPLIVDQPEDDLDNQVVPKIAEQIWDAKAKRQLIFASHNANLVVNGDAELVVCCDYREAGDQSAGQIKREGAIDVETVRQEIASVMEGGEEAFKLRRDKYGF